MLFKKRITKDRIRYLENVLVDVVAKYINRDDVECIWYRCYKDDPITWGKGGIFIGTSESVSGNIFGLNILFKEKTKEIENEVQEENYKYNNPIFISNSGVDLMITAESKDDYKIIEPKGDHKITDINEVDLEKGIPCSMHDWIAIRELYFANILYDKTDGYYYKVGHQLDNYVDFDKVTIDRDINIDIDDVKIKEKTLGQYKRSN